MKTIYFVSANRRVWTRVCDFIVTITIAFLISIFYLLIKNKKLSTTDNYDYVIVAMFFFLTFTIYFIIIPYFTNKTLFCYIFKIEIYFYKKNKIWLLIKKDFFVWIYLSIASMIVTFCYIFISSVDHDIYFREVATIFKFNYSYKYVYHVVVFSSMYVFVGIVSLISFVNLILKSKHRFFLDFFSYSAVIYSYDITKPAVKNKIDGKKKDSMFVDDSIKEEIKNI